MTVAPVPVDVNVALESFFRGNITVWTKLRVLLGIPVYAFGAMTEARDLAKRGIMAENQKVVKEREKLIRDVKALYYGILFGKEMESLLNRSIDGITNKVESEEASEDPGLSPFEILELKVFREELATGLEKAKVEMDLAYEGLRIQMGLPRDYPIALKRKTLDPEVVELAKLDKYVNASMAHTPDSKLIEIGVDAKRKLWKLEKLKLAPQLGIGFFVEAARAAGDIQGITQTDDYNNPFNYTRAGIGLRVQGKIDFFSAYGRIKKARAEYLKSLYEGRMGKRGLRLDARKSYDEVVKLKKKVISTRRASSLSNDMVFLSKTNFELGIGEVNDYRRALELTLTTRGQYLKAVFDYNTALATLEQKVGVEAFAELTGRPNIPVYEAFGTGDDFDVDMIEDEGGYEYDEEGEYEEEDANEAVDG